MLFRSLYVRYEADGTIKSSVDKFYSQDVLKAWLELGQAKPGDLMLVMAGPDAKTKKALGELRLHVGEQLGLRPKNVFVPLWVLDFPLLEYGEKENRWFAMHHPFTAPVLDKEKGEFEIDAFISNKKKSIKIIRDRLKLLKTIDSVNEIESSSSDLQRIKNDKSFKELSDIKANAYDLVINGMEVGGGSIRIFNKALQAQMFDILGFTPEDAQSQFGFLMNAFEYGAPPHGGIAFGFDRLCMILGEGDSIRDFIAFPKNNAGRDVMIDAPSLIDAKQKKELGLA